MSVDRDSTQEGFLRRWARVKGEARETAPAAADPAPQGKGVPDALPPPELPPIDQLTLESDFSAFFHPKVEEDVRRQALRKLFSEPHFNVMDGLDVYIDDYSKTEPIPAAMLAGLKQAQRILEWAAEKPAEKEGAPANTNASPAIEEPAPALSPAAPGEPEPPPARATSPVHKVPDANT